MWTKIGAEFLTDPSFLSISRGARLLHIEATIWSNQQGTDGRVPAYMLARISDDPDVDAAAQELINADRWEREFNGETYVDEKSGKRFMRTVAFQLIDFLDNQPSADDAARTRKLAADRQRRLRQHRGGDHSLCTTQNCQIVRQSRHA